MKDLMENQKEDQYEESEAEEEALSFCDFALGGDREDLPDSREFDHRRSTEEELFEFFNDLTSEKCFSQDIIFCGKLLSYSSPVTLSNYSNKIEEESDDQFFDFTSESDSLNESQRSNSMRSFYSLDYRKPKRSMSSAKKNNRNRILARKCDFPVRKVTVRPKWNFFMFGLMKFPTNMKLRDIRIRQSQLNRSSMFPSFDGGETVSVKRGGVKRSSWWRRVLRALGCKSHVRASLGCIPHGLT